MRFAIRWVAALALPAMLLTGSFVSAQKKPNVDKDKDVPNGEKMVKAGVLVGTVDTVYEDKRKIRLKVAVPSINPSALQSIAMARLTMAQARTAQAMVQAQMQMRQAQATLYTTTTQDIELAATDEVVVRAARPREDFDEKGKIKKFTRAELKELKGPDPKLPGYKAEFGDVASGQVIQVTLVRKKTTGPAPRPVAIKPRAKGKNKDADAEVAVDLLADNLPQISQIVILAEPRPMEK